MLGTPATAHSQGLMLCARCILSAYRKIPEDCGVSIQIPIPLTPMFHHETCSLLGPPPTHRYSPSCDFSMNNDDTVLNRDVVVPETPNSEQEIVCKKRNEKKLQIQRRPPIDGTWLRPDWHCYRRSHGRFAVTTPATIFGWNAVGGNLFLLPYPYSPIHDLLHKNDWPTLKKNGSTWLLAAKNRLTSIFLKASFTFTPWSNKSRGMSDFHNMHSQSPLARRQINNTQNPWRLLTIQFLPSKPCNYTYRY